MVKAYLKFKKSKYLFKRDALLRCNLLCAGGGGHIFKEAWSEPEWDNILQIDGPSYNWIAIKKPTLTGKNFSTAFTVHHPEMLSTAF